MPTNELLIGHQCEHPTEAARKALMLAVDAEDATWAPLFRRVAMAMPHRSPVSPDELADMLLARRAERIAALRGELDRLGADVFGDEAMA